LLRNAIRRQGDAILAHTWPHKAGPCWRLPAFVQGTCIRLAFGGFFPTTSVSVSLADGIGFVRRGLRTRSSRNPGQSVRAISTIIGSHAWAGEGTDAWRVTRHHRESSVNTSATSFPSTQRRSNPLPRQGWSRASRRQTWEPRFAHEVIPSDHSLQTAGSKPTWYAFRHSAQAWQSMVRVQ